MPIVLLVGAQWGDEGKGKRVDYLAKQSDLILGLKSGYNPGHTVINDYGVFSLHLIPFSKIKLCVEDTLSGTLIKGLKESQDLEKIGPVDMTLPRWICDTTKVRNISDLFKNAKKYLNTIKELVGTKVPYVGACKNREDLAIL